MAQTPQTPTLSVGHPTPEKKVEVGEDGGGGSANVSYEEHLEQLGQVDTVKLFREKYYYFDTRH